MITKRELYQEYTTDELLKEHEELKKSREILKNPDLAFPRNRIAWNFIEHDLDLMEEELDNRKVKFEEYKA